MGDMEKGCGGRGWSSLCCTLSKDELGDSRTLAEPRVWLGELIFLSRSGQGPCRRDQQLRAAASFLPCTLEIETLAERPSS